MAYYITIIVVLTLLVIALVYFLSDAYSDLLETIIERDKVREQCNELNKQLAEQAGEISYLRAFMAQPEIIAERYAPMNLEPNIKPEMLDELYIPERRTLVPLNERSMFPL